jgi:adenylosuccinate synthase
MIHNVDIVADLSWGDTGKGKVSAHLASSGEYDFVARWAGGNNAGHTVYVDGKKYKTHIIPSGVFYGVKSVIGPGCVINEKSFYDELTYLSDNGFDTSLVKVSPRAHVVTKEHIETDSKGLSHLGTTKRGIAPCYAEKMMRSGVMAKNVFKKELLFDSENMYGNILCEGAQGFYLDIDWGNYPFVTSSTTLPYGACSLGFSPHKIRNIWGLCKAYDTRAGNDPYFENKIIKSKSLLDLADIGEEYGVTTGRKRQTNWLNLDLLIRAIKISGANILVVNKCDIIKSLDKYNVIYENSLISFSGFDGMKMYIQEKLASFHLDNIIFSGHKSKI